MRSRLRGSWPWEPRTANRCSRADRPGWLRLVYRRAVHLLDQALDHPIRHVSTVETPVQLGCRDQPVTKLPVTFGIRGSGVGPKRGERSLMRQPQDVVDGFAQHLHGGSMVERRTPGGAVEHDGTLCGSQQTRQM